MYGTIWHLNPSLDTPQQKNTKDCGVFVMEIGPALRSRGRSGKRSFSADTNDLRRRQLFEICAKTLLSNATLP